jgi:predicted acyltransferase
MSDPAQNRLTSLDVFRGATVAAMLLVNNPGSWSAIYPPLEHAEWHGWTPTDLIFPFFLFIVGVTTELSAAVRRERGATTRDLLLHTLRRGSIIFLLGVLLNAFPFYTWGKVEGIADPTLLQRIQHRFANLRYLGVLQRIGLVYLVSTPLILRLRTRTLLWLGTAILLGYWALLTIVPLPDGRKGSAVLNEPSQTIAARSDRAVLGKNHIWRHGDWDPEGPLSTLPAIVTALSGALAGRLLRDSRTLSDKVKLLLLYGLAGTALGLLWGLIFPINKNLWTSSYVVFTSGAAAILLAATLWLVDLRAAARHDPGRQPRWVMFFVVYGLNPLVAFVGSGIMARLTDSLIRWRTEGKMTNLHLWLHQHLFESWLPPRPASLAYALTFVFFWFLLLAAMRKRRWIVKV